MGLQCPPLIMITLDQHESDNNKQIIQLTLVYDLLR